MSVQCSSVPSIWRETFETERLRLRPLAMSDGEPLYALQRDPLMMRYFGGRTCERRQIPGLNGMSQTAASAGLPAGTFGKTGTAEFGTSNPPQTDAWFIGYNGDLAFAVLVVGGGVGGAVAAPIAAKFLATAGSVP